jgi:thiamine biosynthesis lipoprotein
MCDALSTALFVMGTDKAIEYWQNNPTLFDMVLVTDDKKIYITNTLQDSLTNVSSMPLEVIAYE